MLDHNSFSNEPIPISGLPAIEDVMFLPIEPAYAKILYISNGIIFGVLLIPLLGFVVFYLGLFSWLSYVLLLFWFALALLSLWVSHTAVNYKSYAIRQRDISYKTGIFFKEWITIPFTRVQHCEISRGVLDRAFDLAELRIFTAGGSSSDIAIPGLQTDVAQQLKDFIIAKIKDHDEEE